MSEPIKEIKGKKFSQTDPSCTDASFAFKSLREYKLLN